MCPVDQETPGARRGALQLAEMVVGGGAGPGCVPTSSAALSHGQGLFV